MSLRRDALAASAEMILALEALWSDDKGVGTVGRVAVSPNATNVIPGQVEFTAEMRSTDAAILDARQREFASTVQSITARRAVTADTHLLSAEPPVPIAESVQSTLADVVQSLGHSPRRLPSYAGHDANQLAKLAPIGMLFIPSKAGRSHCPEEWTDLTDVALGARALGEAVLQFDSRVPAT